MAHQKQNTGRGPENSPSSMDKAEGSRDNVNVDQQPDRERVSGHQPASGISNRSLDAEEQEQAELPLRGLSKDEADDEE